jgi:hypothetical protein
MPPFLPVNTQTTHIKSIKHNSVAKYALKTLYPGGIRTQALCFWGECDVDCATPPGRLEHSLTPRADTLYSM